MKATPTARRSRGMVLIELIVAMAILTLVVIPLAFEFETERQSCRASYQRAIAMEIVDGEMETLMAGAWRSVDEGAHPYTVRAESAQNLPRGQFISTRHGHQLRLEWTPQQPGEGGRVVREGVAP